MTRAILIHTDGTFEITEIVPSFETLRDAVGGWIEAVDADSQTTIYVNEEGKLLGLPINDLATRLWRQLNPLTGDFIAGPAVVLGPVDSTGNETAVNEATLATFFGLVDA